jgi:hypothetical protein
LQGNGATASSARVNDNTQGGWRYGANDTGSTTNTFASSEFYFPSYLTSQAKPYSLITATENNATTGYINSLAELYNSTSSISSITLSVGGGSYNFDTGSSFYLYGVFNGPETLPSTPTIGTATATGGSTATVAFTPTSATGVDASYTALSTPGSITATGNSSPVSVTGLTPGTAYTFQVKANNPGGSSAYSSASNSVTPVAGDYYSIASTELTNGSTTLTFSSIPQTYTHLQIRFSAFVSTANDVLQMRYNGDSSGYRYHEMYAVGAAYSASGVASNQAQIRLYGFDYGTITGVPVVGIVDVSNYSSTDRYKTGLIFSGTNNNSATQTELNLISTLYQSTSAITSITIYIQGVSTFVSGNVALYGIKGA